MVLVNGVKYACERCIRGHRVTTCTHTDQPLMMIKPKGRPSTQCPFCKEQRRIRNSHVNCNCSKKINSKAQHDPSCPCHISGECTCCAKNKKSKKKNSQDQSNISTPNSNSNSNISSCHDTKSPLTSTKRDQRKLKSPLDSEIDLKFSINSENNSENTSPIKTPINNNLVSPISTFSTNQLLDSNTLDLTLSSNLNMQNLDLTTNDSISGLITPSPRIISSNNDMKLNDRDSINSVLQSWDMASPPMGNSESLASLLSENSYNQSRNNNKLNNKYSRQIGLDPLQNFRSSSNTRPQDISSQQIQHQQQQQQQQHQQQRQQQLIQQQIQQQRGMGEISIPVDEYIKPLNKMNVNFNNFLSNLSDSSPIEVPIASPNNSVSPGQISNNELNLLSFNKSANNNNTNTNTNINDNNNIFSANSLSNTTTNINNNSSNFNAFNNIGISNDTTKNMNTNSNLNQSNNKISNLYDVVPPTPGNGLLDIFEDNIPTHKIYQNSQSASVSDSQDHAPDSLFPLFPLIGPSYSQGATTIQNDESHSIKTQNGSKGNAPLSHSNLNNFNMRPIISNSEQNLLQQAAYNQAAFNTNASPQLYRDITGSSMHSNNSFQSFHSIHSSHSSNHSNHSNHSHHSHHSHYQHSHHGGSHGHSHQSHFQPYPSSHPRRSSSFLSISSSHTVASSSTGSPVSFAEHPKLLTAESTDSIPAYTGPQLSNAKTNTTLMDDIYQTKTYTDSQSVATAKRASVSNNNVSIQQQQQQPQSQQPQQEQQQQFNSGGLGDQYLNTDTSNTDHNVGNFNKDDYIENFGPMYTSLDMIGTIPMTSSMFLSDNNKLSGKSPTLNEPGNEKIDQYDEQLFESLLSGDI
ncbi:hypothetical protein C6P42_004498 [Pichia californica]|nr:hypothetical protein C6P42_004498 [[Candida] californica]